MYLFFSCLSSSLSLGGRDVSIVFPPRRLTLASAKSSCWAREVRLQTPNPSAPPPAPPSAQQHPFAYPITAFEAGRLGCQMHVNLRLEQPSSYVGDVNRAKPGKPCMHEFTSDIPAPSWPQVLSCQPSLTSCLKSLYRKRQLHTSLDGYQPILSPRQHFM